MGRQAACRVLDIPPKVTGEYRYVSDLRVPGMLHGRVIRPPEAGAKLVRVDDSARLPGLVKVVRQGDFLGVVCEREEQAIEAARRMKAEWSKPAPMFWSGYDELYAILRAAKPRTTKQEPAKGRRRCRSRSPRASSRRATNIRSSRTPRWGLRAPWPTCATAARWSGSAARSPIRAPRARRPARAAAGEVRVVWMPGPGSYGMNDADDCAADAALLARAAGRPVRLQYMRVDGTGWDPKGPPIAFRMRAGVSTDGGVFAWDYEARGFSGRTRNNGTDVAGDTLAGQLMGGHPAKISYWPQFSTESYGFPNVRKVSHSIDWDRSLRTGLRTAHLRDPDGMATCFASESFIDELAFATGIDPVEFRLRYLTDAARHRGGEGGGGKGGMAEARGAETARRRAIRHRTRHRLRAAQPGDAGDRRGGRGRSRDRTLPREALHLRARLRLRREPASLKGTIEANLIQGMSRAMHEAVRFDPTRVLSVDWLTYPIVDMTEVPDAIDIVVLNNRPEARSRGAGEPSIRPVAAAIANAIFDATGARLRRVPLTPEAVLAAI